MNKKYTKSALFGSVIALILCCAMLIGTTFAWFTDTESTGINTIQSGNLDIGVYYALQSDVVNGAVPDNAWKRLDENTPVFNQDALWEPGYTEIVYFKTINEGTLALQYQLHVDIVDEKQGINVAGELFTLSEHIEAYACTQSWNYVFPTRESALNPSGAPEVWHAALNTAAKDAVNYPDGHGTAPLSLDHWNWLEPNKAETLYTTLVLFMPTTVGNEANYATGELAPSLDLGISVVATQYNWENEVDSFDHNYDENAEFPELPAAPVVPGKDITLSDTYEDDEEISFVNTSINGTVTVDVVANPLTMTNVSGKTKLVMKALSTVLINDCDFDSLEIVNETDRKDFNIIFQNVTVDGVEITEENVLNYCTGFGDQPSIWVW